MTFKSIRTKWHSSAVRPIVYRCPFCSCYLEWVGGRWWCNSCKTEVKPEDVKEGNS